MPMETPAIESTMLHLVTMDTTLLLPLESHTQSHPGTHTSSSGPKAEQLHRPTAPPVETPIVETTLFSNYPNPFNPETWIPYQLATPAEVTVSIHAADGKLVRTLELGRLSAGVYQNKSRAAYWDGKNEQGEAVASGIYFYTLKAGDFSATKKMLIRK